MVPFVEKKPLSSWKAHASAVLLLEGYKGLQSINAPQTALCDI